MASASNTTSDSETFPTNTSNTANHRSSNQAPSMDDSHLKYVECLIIIISCINCYL